MKLMWIFATLSMISSLYEVTNKTINLIAEDDIVVKLIVHMALSSYPLSKFLYHTHSRIISCLLSILDRIILVFEDMHF